jgi:hydroxymethylglutaryl-CoA lyase
MLKSHRFLRNGLDLSRRRFASHSANNTVNIVEVGARDGLQNEKTVIPTHVKVELINRLGRAGLQTIEAGRFSLIFL